MPNQLTAYSDDNMEGLTKLAKLIKEKGNKAIMQLHHAGRESVGTYQKFGKVFAPSAIEFPFLQYVPQELTHEEILEIIEAYGEATRRAIEAGYDGVEIVRYRITTEEVHGENVGYTIDDTLVLVEEIVKSGVDYLHISSAGNSYDAMPTLGGKGEPLAASIYKQVDGRTTVLVAGDISTPDKALDALNYADVCMLGRTVLIDPDFVTKLEAGKEDEICYSVEGRLDDLAFPPILVGFWQMPGSPLPVIIR